MLSYSVLYFSNSDNHGDIGRYNLSTASEFVPAGGFPGDVSVDEAKEVVYWTNYISGSDTYEVMKTYYNQTTVQLTEYAGPIAAIKLAQGERYLYVLNPTSAELDIIDKESEEVLETYSIRAATSAVAAADGKFVFPTCIMANFAMFINFYFYLMQDVDECCLGGYCHVYATCTNKPGGYDCQCKSGLTGNGTYCEGLCFTLCMS
jgi:hypothetical protein